MAATPNAALKDRLATANRHGPKVSEFSGVWAYIPLSEFSPLLPNTLFPGRWGERTIETADLVWIIGRVAQRSQFPLHDRLWHRKRMPPLRVHMVVN